MEQLWYLMLVIFTANNPISYYKVYCQCQEKSLEADFHYQLLLQYIPSVLEKNMQFYGPSYVPKRMQMQALQVGSVGIPIHLSYETYFFSERILFFSHNKSANSTFSHGLSAKRTGPCYFTVTLVVHHEPYWQRTYIRNPLGTLIIKKILQLFILTNH